MSELHVIFGTGALGKWTARELVRQGKTVRMINQSGKAARLPAGVEIVAGNAFDLSTNITLTKGATTVYQCAQPKYEEWVEKFPSLQQAILEAAAHNRARLVVGDNLYAYGQFTGTLREDGPIAPISKKGKVRAAMAEAVLKAHTAGKVSAAIGRASDFFGPDDQYLTRYTILPAVQGRTANLLGRTDRPHSYTYIADFGKLLAMLGTREEALGQAWFAPTNPPITQADFVDLIEEELRRPVKTIVGSPLMMRILGLFNREIAESVEMMYEWTNPFVIDSRKVTESFGLKPTSMKEAIQETIEWCKGTITRDQLLMAPAES